MRTRKTKTHSSAYTGLAVSILSTAAIVAVAQAPTGQETMEEIVVTGSYLQGRSESEAIAPIDVVAASEMADMGVSEFSEVIERLTINTGSENNPDAFTQNLSTGTSNVNLRGLGVGATLVLLNGQRQTASAITTDDGESFVDTSSLPPLIALDRVEILQDGASALYGSDAVAGVVNLITRDGFYGLDLQADVQSAYPRDHSERRFSALFGSGNDRAHFLAALSTLRRAAFGAAERRLSGPLDDLSQAGNPGSFVVPGEPGALPVIVADPDCETIAATDPNVVPSRQNTTGLCQFDFGNYFALVPEEEQLNTYLQLGASLGRTLEANFEYHAAVNESQRSNSPSFPFATYPRIGSDHPDNPFGREVRFIGRIQGSGASAARTQHNSDTRRIAMKLSGTLGSRWSWRAGAHQSANAFSVAAEDVLADRFSLALQGLGSGDCSSQASIPGRNGCVYFNPFATSLTGRGTTNSAELYDYLIGPFRVSAERELTTFGTVVSGALTSRSRVAFGAELREESLDYRYDEESQRNNFMFFGRSENFDATRRARALFTEFELPLGDSAAVQIAARHEDYGELGSTDPTLSVYWTPGSELTLRSSLGSSFRAPSLFQAAGTQSSLAELIDPAVGVPQFIPVRTEPNPRGSRLNPEHAKTLHTSLAWSSAAGLDLKIAYWSFDYRDVIIRQSPQALLRAATHSNAQVERDPTSGALLRVNTYYDNASSLNTSGYDLFIDSTVETGGPGQLKTGLAATLTMKYDLVDPQLGLVNGAGRRNFANFATSVPRHRARFFLYWQRGPQKLNLNMNYIGDYLDDEAVSVSTTPLTRIGDHFTVDLNYNIRITENAEVSLGAINLFDADPPYVATNGGYDSKVHDPRGRLIFLRARIEI